MCGRFTQSSDLSTVTRRFGVPEALVRAEAGPPRFNIAPSAQILAVRQSVVGPRELVRLKWGLVPHWSVEPRTGYSTSNARAESVDTKPAFRSAFRRRRCLIPAEGWFEWQTLPDQKTKQPWFYRGQEDALLAFAGLWERWEQKEAVLESCTIIVCEANGVARPVHDRMPVILGEDDWGHWLDPNVPVETAKALLQPCPEAWVRAYPVSRAVSYTKNEGPQLIEAVEPGLLG
jgi:putative SOS response-associated peptidase YedK